MQKFYMIYTFYTAKNKRSHKEVIGKEKENEE